MTLNSSLFNRKEIGFKIKNTCKVDNYQLYHDNDKKQRKMYKENTLCIFRINGFEVV